MRSDTPPRIERLEPADRDRDRDAEPERLVLLRHHVRGGERADADERLMAERDLADVAEQHVERQADDPEDHRLGVLLHLERLAPEREDQHEPRERDPDDAARDPAERRRPERLGCAPAATGGAGGAGPGAS